MTWLDLTFLVARGVEVHPPLEPGIPAPLRRPGAEIAAELGGRKLLRFLTRRQVHRHLFVKGTTTETFVTPTANAPQDVAAWLLLPSPEQRRSHVLILEPQAIPWIQGPLWVGWGKGIQCILPDGFPQSAIIVPGAPGVHRELEIS